LLVIDVLRGLVGPEAKSSTGTLHDDVGTQATENTGLVVFARIQVCDDGVVRLSELRFAGRTRIAALGVLSRYTELLGTFYAEYMTDCLMSVVC
jgi:hypothetical protein